MKLHVEYEQEEDGRWTEIPELLGVMCYVISRNDAASSAQAEPLASYETEGYLYSHIPQDFHILS